MYPFIAHSRSNHSGQSLIESCVATALICLIFMGLLQVSQLAAASEILYHSAARGARAKTVGFNWWMVEKSMRVAAIPNAGKMVVPYYVNENLALRAMISSMSPGQLWSTLLGIRPASAQYDIERARIPEYMASENWQRGGFILDYEKWNSIRGMHDDSTLLPDGTYQSTIRVSAYQSYSNWVPLHRTFYASDHVDLTGDSFLENHYPLYIDDMGW